MGAVALTGCGRTDVSVSRHDQEPIVVEKHYIPAEGEVVHVCNRHCQDHYWDGSRIIIVEKGHEHKAGCGHVWDGRHWVLAQQPAKRVRSGPQKVKVVDPNHEHSAKCGCVFDLRSRTWVAVPGNHVHGKGCGHIYSNGKWCMQP